MVAGLRSLGRGEPERIVCGGTAPGDTLCQQLSCCPAALTVDRMQSEREVDIAWLDPRIAEIVASAVCGGVVTLLLFRIAKKRGRFSFFVHHNRIAMSADDPIFGKVQVTWNQEPVGNLFLSTVEMKNDSLKDFKDVVVKVFTNDTILLTERTEIVDTTQVLRWSPEFRESLHIAAGGPAPFQMELYNTTREYIVPTMNRGQLIRFAFLNAPGQGVQPSLWLDIVHPGVKLQFRAVPTSEILGVSQPASALVGFLIGLVFLGAVILFVQSTWIAAGLAFLFGSFLVLPGALMIRCWYRLRGLVGS